VRGETKTSFNTCKKTHQLIENCHPDKNAPTKGELDLGHRMCWSQSQIHLKILLENDQFTEFLFINSTANMKNHQIFFYKCMKQRLAIHNLTAD